MRFNISSRLTARPAIATWGTDADNKIIIDNFKLESLPIGTPPLGISLSGDNVVVTWGPPSSGTVKLQSSLDLKNWADVPSATSPYSTPLAGAPKYFRTQWVPPTP